MSIRIVRLGSPRSANEGLRIGTARRPPRGVPKEKFAALDYYDVWFPNLAPSAELLTFGLSKPLEGAHYNAFAKRYRAEMNAPDRARELEVLTALSKQTNFAVGCYCEQESQCHRSVLRALFIERGATVTG